MQRKNKPFKFARTGKPRSNGKPAVSACLEPLEQRVLFSADVFGFDPSSQLGQIEPTTTDDLITLAGDSTPTSKNDLELIFIDSRLLQRELIVEDLLEQKANGRSLEVVVIESNQHGLNIISQSIAGFTDVSAIHILSHGTSEGIQLGNMWLKESNVEFYIADLTGWQNTLSDDADLLIYGCNLAGSEEGLRLLDALAQTTQADIAASSDLTGHENLGANWTLEHTSGPIDAHAILTDNARTSWEHEMSVILANDDNLLPRPTSTNFTLGDSITNDVNILINDESSGPKSIIEITDAPNGGTLTPTGLNNYEYAPNNTQPLSDSFEYLVADDPDILYHWLLDDTGSTAVDQTTRRDGNITGNIPFNGTTNNDFVQVPALDYPDSFTISFDFNLSTTTTPRAQVFFDQGDYFIEAVGGSELGTIQIWLGGSAGLLSGNAYQNEIVTNVRGVEDFGNFDQIIWREASHHYIDGWHNYTLTIEGTDTNYPQAIVYIDGQKILSDEGTESTKVGVGGFQIANTNNDQVTIGADILTDSSTLDNTLEDNQMRNLRIYDGIKVPSTDPLQAHPPLNYDTATVNIDLQSNIGPDITVASDPDITEPENATNPAAPISFPIEVNATDDVTVTVSTKDNLAPNLQNGTLQVPNTNASVTVTNISANDLTLKGPVIEVNKELALLTYTPPANYHDEDPLVDMVQDDLLTIKVDSQLIEAIDKDSGIQYDENNTPLVNNELFRTDPILGDIISLNTHGEHIALQNHNGLQPQEATIAAWINLTDTNDTAEIISFRNVFGIRTDSNDHLQGYATYNGLEVTTNAEIGAYDLEDDGWHHVAFRIVNGHQQLFLDGVKVGESYNNQPLDYNGADNRVIIGIDPSDMSNTDTSFVGEIDDAFVFQRALHITEIEKLSQAQDTSLGVTNKVPIRISPTNDAPSMSGLLTGANFTEAQTNYVLLESSGNIAIEDVEAEIRGSYDGYSVTLQRSGFTWHTNETVPPNASSTPNTADHFDANSGFIDSANSVVLDSDGKFGTIDQNSGGVLKVTFEDTSATVPVTKDRINSFLNSITYFNNDVAPPMTAEISWMFADNGHDNFGNTPHTNLSTTGLSTVYFNRDNSTPVITNNNPLTAYFTASNIITQSELFTQDDDHVSTDLRYNLLSLPLHGQLERTDGTILAINDDFSQADINSSLISYVANPGTVDISDEFLFSVFDALNANVASQLFTINVTSDTNNQSPALSNIGSSVTFTEDGNAVKILENAMITDADSATLQSAKITLVNGTTNDTLALPSQSSGITGTFSGGVLSLSKTGTPGTHAEYEDAIQSITFANSSQNPAEPNPPRSISIVLDDGNSSGVAATRNIIVVPQNDAPINTVPTTAQTVNEDTSLAITGISVEDVDNNLSSVLLSVNNGTLNVELSGTAAISAGANGSNNLTLSGSLADINIALATLTYQGLADFKGSDVLTVFSTDDSAATDSYTVYIAIDAVNDEEVLAFNTGATVAEGSSGNVIDATTLDTTDVDNFGVQLVYTIDTATTNGTLFLSGTALSVNDTFTQADVNAGDVTYDHDDSQTSSDSFNFTVDDGAGTVTTDTFNFIVTNVNDAPVNTVPVAQTVNEDTPLAISGISVDDADNNLSTVRLNVTNGSLNVALSGTTTISAGTNGSNDLTLSGSLADINTALASLTYQGALHFNGSDTLAVLSTDSNAATDTDTVDITIDAVNDEEVLATNTGRTVDEGSTVNVINTTMLDTTDVDNFGVQLLYTVDVTTVNGTLFLNGIALGLNDTFTQSDLSAGNVTYDHDDSQTASDSFDFTIDDGAGTVTSDTFNFTVINVNDAPVNVVPVAQTVDEDTPLAITGISATDVDNNLSTVQLTVANGTLNAALSGTATITAGSNDSNDLTLSGSPADVNAALAGLTYQGVLDFNGTETLTMLSTDSDGTTDSDTVNITIDAVNDEEILVTNTGSTVAEGSTGNVIVATMLDTTDVDNLGPQLVYTLNAPTTNGTLFLNGAPLVLNDTFSQADLNAGSVAYDHDDSQTASDSFDFTVDDGAGTNTPATFNFTVTNVNDAPVIANFSGNTLPPVFTENGSGVAITNSLTITDVDDENIENAYIKITSNYSADDALFLPPDPVNYPNITSIFSGTGTPTPGLLTLSGAALKSEYVAAIHSVEFINTSDDPDQSNRTVSLYISDGEDNSTFTLLRTIAVEATNDAPVILNLEPPAVPATYTENSTPANITATAIVDDKDDTQIEFARVLLTNPVAGDTLTLDPAVRASTGIDPTLYVTASQIELRLENTASLAAYQSAIQAVTFENTTHIPTDTTRTVAIMLNDGDDPSAPVTRNIEVTAVNDAPTLTGIEPATSFTENGSPVDITNNLTVNDLDTDLTSAAISIVNFVSGEDELLFVNANGINGDFDPTSGELTLTGTASVADYQAAIRSVTYTNTSEDPAATTRTISIEVNDGTDKSTVASRDININPVNDAPQFSPATNVSAHYTEDNAPTLFAGSVSLADVDNTTLQSATITLTNHVNSEDLLHFSDQGTITHSFDATTGELILTGTASLAQYETAIESVRYQNISQDPTAGIRNIIVTVDDGTANSNAGEREISVVAVDDAPVITALESSALTYTENQTTQTTITDSIDISDIDNASLASANVTIDNMIAGDQLVYVTQGNIAGSYNSNSGILELTGAATPNQYANAIQSVVFLSTSDDPTNTSRNLFIEVSDGTNQTFDTREVKVIPVNDSPTGQDNTLSTDDTDSYSFRLIDFPFTDLENDSMSGIVINTPPISGTLTLMNQLLVAGDIVTKAQIVSGDLSFIPDENSGVTQTNFTYSIKDTGGVADNGIDTDVQPNTITFNLGQVNDSPVPSVESIHIDEGATQNTTTSGASSLLDNAFDADADTLAIEVTTQPQFGVLTIDESTGTFSYEHNGSEDHLDQFTYTLTDGKATVEQTVDIIVSPTNDAPTANIETFATQTATFASPFSVELPISNFNDVDGDILTFTARVDDGTPQGADLPTWLSFSVDTATGTLIFDGSPTTDEPLNIIVIASDAESSASTALQLTINPATEPQMAAATQQEEPESQASATEPDSDVMDEGTVEANEPISFTEEIADEEPAVQTPIEVLEELALYDNTSTNSDNNDLLITAKLVEQHRNFQLKTLTGSSNLLQVQENTPLADLFYTDEKTELLKKTKLAKKLDDEREQLENILSIDTRTIGGAVSVSTGLSIGYVIWLVRGGLLLGSVMSALPAWRNIDPLPVLSTLTDGSEEDDDSLEEMVAQSPEEMAQGESDLNDEPAADKGQEG